MAAPGPCGAQVSETRGLALVANHALCKVLFELLFLELFSGL